MRLMVDQFVGIKCFVMRAESCFTIKASEHESESGQGTASWCNAKAVSGRYNWSPAETLLLLALLASSVHGFASNRRRPL